jgi:hypothetical protein
MTAFKEALACGVALAGLAIAQPARATLTLTVTDANAGVIGACSATDGGTGSLAQTCSNANFLVIIPNALGAPLLLMPGLSANEVAFSSFVGGPFRIPSRSMSLKPG